MATPGVSRATEATCSSANLERPAADELIKLSKHVGALKRTLRTGWVRRKVDDPESVAEHSYRMAMLALLYGPGVKRSEVMLSSTARTSSGCSTTRTTDAAGGARLAVKKDMFISEGASTAPQPRGDAEEQCIDVMRCCRMALVHDLAEGIVGDLVVDGSAECRDNISKEAKQRLEESAINEILLGTKRRSTSDGTRKSRSPSPASDSKNIKRRKEIQKINTTNTKSDGGTDASARPDVVESRPEVDEPTRTKPDLLQEVPAYLRRREMCSELLSLWHEYEAQETAEARFVKDLDRLEMLLQADDYLDEKQQSPQLNLDDFYASTKGKFRSDVAQAVDAALRDKHAQRKG
ncbi:unnamed protein product [Amoebophrya sp. A120]|nr:unnamed protein product [Amoebophrya sp. A120]|eukprot:GSA120T00002609001.1